MFRAVVVLLLSWMLTEQAHAHSTEDVLAQLAQEGYVVLNANRTLLGRVRIKAVSETEKREIVIDPRTGEVLRDFSRPLDERDADTVARDGSDDEDRPKKLTDSKRPPPANGAPPNSDPPAGDPPPGAPPPDAPTPPDLDSK